MRRSEQTLPTDSLPPIEPSDNAILYTAIRDSLALALRFAAEVAS